MFRSVQRRVKIKTKIFRGRILPRYCWFTLSCTWLFQFHTCGYPISPLIFTRGSFILSILAKNIYIIRNLYPLPSTLYPLPLVPEVHLNVQVYMYINIQVTPPFRTLTHMRTEIASLYAQLGYVYRPRGRGTRSWPWVWVTNGKWLIKDRCEMFC